MKWLKRLFGSGDSDQDNENQKFYDTLRGHRNPTPTKNISLWPTGPGIKVELKTNLIEIRLQDTESLPEVWYKGKRIDSALVDTYFYWRTSDDKDSGDCNVRVKFLEKMEDQTHIHNRL